MFRKFFFSSRFILIGCMFNIMISAQGKYEPATGAYIGAFIVNDPVVQGSIPQFESLTGKKHSSYFSYAAYGAPFPSDWVNEYASRNNVVQIAFEPHNGLASVVDDEYIREWARSARKSGAMIFLRWACEMNGSWVPWYGDPELYKQKFRMIHGIMQEEAPNVAMVWAPNDVPNDSTVPANYIHAYYPGDEYVDWVGIDFYGVYFYTNGAPERKQPGEKLKIVYDRYSPRKPIIICEWAAAHFTNRVTPAVNCSSYAMQQMDSLYGYASSRFPRLRSINWFSMNSLSQNGCNFTLTENPAVLNHYKEVVNSPYFISAPFRNVPKVTTTFSGKDTVLRGSVSFTVSPVSDSQIDSVTVYLGPQRISHLISPPYTIVLNTNNFPDGNHVLRTNVHCVSGYSNYDLNRIIIDNANKYVNIIVDDITGNGFNVTGAWNISSSQPDRYGSYYHFSLAGDGSNKAFWEFGVPYSGSYNVYGFWSAHPNRATDAPFVVPAADGDTFRVNQEINGGRWNLLGTSYFNEGIGRVELNNNANEIVIADAIRIEWAFNSTSGVESSRVHSINTDELEIFPNPVSYDTQVRFRGTGGEGFDLKLYDTQGRLISERKGVFTAEEKTLNLFRDLIKEKLSKLTAGVYFLRITGGKSPARTCKFIYLK